MPGGALERAHAPGGELYLRWLEKHEQEAGEEPPLGLILCADESEEEVDLLQLDQTGIRVTAYLTELPSREVSAKKLHGAARLRWGFLDEMLPAPWIHRDEKTLYGLTRHAEAEGRVVDVVEGLGARVGRPVGEGEAL